MPVDRVIGAQPVHGEGARSRELSREVPAVERGAGPSPRGALCPGEDGPAQQRCSPRRTGCFLLRSTSNVVGAERVRPRWPKRLQEGVL